MRDEIARNGLGKICIPEPGVSEQSFLFGTDFVGFAGHFHQYPVLPAVIQLTMAGLVMEALHGRVLEIAAVKRAKFMQPITVDQEVKVCCVDKSVGELPGCKATLTTGGKTAAEFTLSFRVQEAGG